METVIQAISRIYPLPEDSLQAILSLLERVEYKKGHQLFKEGRLGHQLYFIEQGIARAFSNRDDKEITFWFGTEGDVVMSYNSYVSGKPGYETIELLEDSVLYSISQEALQQLFTTNIAIANWGRKLAELELVKTETCFVSQQCLPATERYRNLLETNPQLVLRVPLGHIASYLGVSQVTLSRIRH